SDACTSDVIQPAGNQRGSSIRDPEPIMLAATEQDRSYSLQIVHDVGHELLRYPMALRALGLGVNRMQKNIHACVIELKMTADGERGKAATAHRPEGLQCQQQPVAILNFTLLVNADR